MLKNIEDIFTQKLSYNQIEKRNGYVGDLLNKSIKKETFYKDEPKNKQIIINPDTMQFFIHYRDLLDSFVITSAPCFFAISTVRSLL